MNRNHGGSRYIPPDDGENTGNEAFNAHKALFGDVKPWMYRDGWDIEAEYVDRLNSSRSLRDASLFSLQVELSNLPAKLASLALELDAFEDLVSASRFRRVCWKAQKGNSHGSVYLHAVSSEGGKVRERSLGNLLSSSDAQDELKALVGRNKALNYLKLLATYFETRAKITTYADASGLAMPFTPSRGVHPVSQWGMSAVPIWEEILKVTQQNIARYLVLDDEVNEIAFEFNHDRQPIRYRTIIMRPPVLKTDRMGPGFPGFRVVTNLVRGDSKKRQTMDIVEYKKKRALKQFAKDLEATLGRVPSKDEIREAKKASTVRHRAFSPWLTEDLIAHCHLGKHTTKINRLQARLQKRHEEWQALRERLSALI